jgi:phospholipid-binding lipoprotein MlaA
LIEVPAATPVVLEAKAPPAQVMAGPPPANPMRHAPGDPMEGFNRRMYGVHQGLDRAILRPAAMGYQQVVPKVIRSGLRHFFSNLNEPVVFANFVFQLKPKSAVRTVVRFLINSTIGLAGTIDVAKSKAVELPHRPNSLGDTLGFYGVKPGPYIFLPLLGPSDLRDLLGGQVDGLLWPQVIGKPFDELEYQIPHAILYGLDARAEAEPDLRALLGDALDPYATLRSVYLQDRAGEIAALKGQPIVDEFNTPEDPAAARSQPASAAAAPELRDPLADPAGSPPDPPPPEAEPGLPAPPATPPAAPSAADPGARAQR